MDDDDSNGKMMLEITRICSYLHIAQVTSVQYHHNFRCLNLILIYSTWRDSEIETDLKVWDCTSIWTQVSTID